MSSFPRNLFPITFRKPAPGNESPYNVDTQQLFRQQEVPSSKNKWRSECSKLSCSCLDDPEMNIYRLFYFIYHAALALFAYLPLYYKHSLLLDHRHVGILMGIRPFCKFLGAPFLGSLADKFNRYKAFLYSGIVVYILIYLSVTFVYGVPNSCDSTSNKHDNKNLLNSSKLVAINGTVYSDVNQVRSKLLALYKDDSEVQLEEEYNNASKKDSLFKQAETLSTINLDLPVEESWPLDVYGKKINNDKEIELEEIRGRIFLILLLLTIVAEFFGAPILTLADTATLQSLRKTPFKYGYQAVWGSVGFAVMSFIFGSVLHFTISENEDVKSCPEKIADNYRPVFYGFCSLLLIALFSTFKFHFREYEGKDDSGCTFFNCIRYFANIEYFLFIFIAWFTGVAHGLSKSFLFVHLVGLGATPLILLAITMVQCLSSVLFYIISPKFIVSYGYFTVLYAGLLNYVLVFFLYSFIKDPWMVVPVELLFGISTSFVWSALVSYVGSPPKIGATLQGFLHAMHIGLGSGIGGLFGGMLIVQYGFDWLFRSFSLLTFVIFLVISSFRYWRKQLVEPIWKELWDYSPVACYDEFIDE